MVMPDRSSRSSLFDAGSADHREAVQAFVATAEALEAAAWNTPLRAGKWSPAQVAEHLRLSHTTILAELGGGQGFRVRTAWWHRLVLRLTVLPRVLREGRFPRGVPATREIRPGDGPFDRAEVLAGLVRESEAFLAAVAAPGVANRKLTHPFLGSLSLEQALRFSTQHVRHHHAQVTAPREAAG